MDNAGTRVRAEPLMYQQIPGLEVWPSLLNAMALAICLNGVSMIGGGLANLWMFGSLPSLSVSRSWADFILIIFPTMATGLAMFVAAIAILGKATWGLTCMRITLYCVSAGYVCFAALRIVVYLLQQGRTNPPGIMRYQAIASFTGLLSHLALPLLSLAMLRIYRQSVGRGAA
jgi:hypothetical protein